MDTWGAGLTPANFNAAGTVAVRLTRVTGPDMPRSIDIESVQLVVYHQGTNNPPVAACQNVVKSADALCQAAVAAAEVDNGSSDPDSDPLTLSLSPAGPYSQGATMVTLTVSDGQASDTCTVDAAGNPATQRTRTVTVQDTQPPVITLNGNASVTLECGVDSYTELGATATDACEGSFAATVGGDTVDPGTPGTYTVTYDAIDAAGNDAVQVTRTVTVEDTLPPVIACNAPATIIPPDAPISFTATAEDACAGSVAASVTGFNCYWINPAGKKVDKTKSCVVRFSGATMTIEDSGGVGDIIEWYVSAAAGNGNTASETCDVVVVRPSSAHASHFLHFPQFGSGNGFVSELVLQNPSQSSWVSGSVRFLNPEGGALEVGLTRSDSGDKTFVAAALEFSIGPLGSLTILAGAEQQLRQGSVTVGSDGKLGGLIRFTVPNLGTTTARRVHRAAGDSGAAGMNRRG